MYPSIFIPGFISEQKLAATGGVLFPSLGMISLWIILFKVYLSENPKLL